MRKYIGMLFRMINIFGYPERSTYHRTIVRKVSHYLKQRCHVASYEESLVSGYRTDAFGYDRKSKIWYLCEIKVDPSDLKKAPQQILDTKFHFPKTRFYHLGDTIVPVIAIPKRLAEYLVKVNEWSSLRNTCRMVKVALWVVEQSTVREVMSPRVKKISKTKSARASTARKKPTRAKKSTSQAGAAKTSKAVKTKTTKKKSSQTKKTKSRVGASKTTKSKKSRTSTKRKTATSKSTKTKRTRTKQKK